MAETTAFGDILTGDALAMLRTLPDQSVHCCVTSPPYWGLRDYGVAGQIGLEPSPQEYVAALLPIFKEVWRVLRNDGTLWLNLGDSYIGYHGNKKAHGPAAPSDKPGYWENMRPTSVGADDLKNKDMAGIPWRVAFALQATGWYLRCDCIWHKPNPMPESVEDRPTRAHEYIFLLSKSERYYYDHEAVKEPAVHAADAPRNRWDTKDYTIPGQKPQKRTTRGPGNWGVVPCGFPGENPGRGRTSGPVRDGNASRNRRSVWTIATRPFPDAHFATFPSDLIRPCILAGCPAGGVVLDPFFGTGTTGAVCVEEARRYLGIEINPDYVAMASDRIAEAEMKAKAPQTGQPPAIGARDMNTGPSYQKAVSLRTSRVAYYRQFGNAKSDWEVIDSETGEVKVFGPAQFKALFVPDWQLPPHMRHIAEAAPSWWDWKAARGRA